MSNSLFEYASKREKEPKAEKKAEFAKEKKTASLDENAAREQINKYSKYSEKELLSELFNQVNEQKKSGQFNFSDLANKVEGIRPMLTQEQIDNLDKLLKQIK